VRRNFICLRRISWVKYQRYCLEIRYNFLNEIQMLDPEANFGKSYYRLNKWSKWISRIDKRKMAFRP